MLLSELAEFPVECHVMFVISIILDSRKSNWLAFTTDIQILRSLMKSGTKLPLFVFSLECLADVTKGFNSFLVFFFFFFQLKNRIFPLETNKYLYLSCLWCPKREDEKSHQTLLNWGLCMPLGKASCGESFLHRNSKWMAVGAEQSRPDS